MRTRAIRLAAACLLAAAALPALGCGEEEEREVEEGEPVELGELAYNVQFTRFLNPHDPEDESYLLGQPDAPKGKAYLGVFMEIENEGDSTAEVAEDMEVVDTRDNRYTPERSESEYALELGQALPGGEELPAPNTTASAGPIKGSMVLFLVDELITESRPVELEIHGEAGETGLVELDI